MAVELDYRDLKSKAVLVVDVGELLEFMGRGACRSHKLRRGPSDMEEKSRGGRRRH